MSPPVLFLDFWRGENNCDTNLLSQKPKNERWAVLINEFGEVGVDASLLETGTRNKKKFF